MTIDPETWLREHRIDEIECMVPDLTGMPRGKILPRDRFLRSIEDGSLRMPADVFYQTVTGEYPHPFPGVLASPHMILHPDPETLRLVPWYTDPTAQVMCNVTWRDGTPVTTAPREVLRRVIAAAPHATVVIDVAYVEFDPAGSSAGAPATSLGSM